MDHTHEAIMKVPQRNVNLAAVLNRTVMGTLATITDLLEGQESQSIDFRINEVVRLSLDSITAVQNYKKKTLDLSSKGQRG